MSFSDSTTDSIVPAKSIRNFPDIEEAEIGDGWYISSKEFIETNKYTYTIVVGDMDDEPETDTQFVLYLDDPGSGESREVATLTYSGTPNQHSEAQTPTQTPTETPTPTPEPVNESFRADFEGGDIRTSREWTLSLQDKSATPKKEADAKIVDESGPDDGSGSLSISANNGGRVVATTSDQYQWNAPWVVEGMFKPEIRDSRFANTRIGLLGGEILLTMDFHRTTVKIEGGPVKAGPTDIGEWKSGSWYGYDCEYDGESTYALTVWELSSARPERPTAAVQAGRIVNPRTAPLQLRAYAGGDISVNHAYISYNAGEALN